jgi:L-gulono-1,4-lactone dehydrogenase
MPLGDLFGNIINKIKDAVFPKTPIRKKLDALKADPTNRNLAKEAGDLFVKNPLQGVLEVLRRVNVSQKKKPAPPANPFTTLRDTWYNTIKKEYSQPLEYLRPTTRQELVTIIKNAEAKKLMVRAVATGHSFSDVAKATDLLVNMLGLNNFLPVETDTFKKNDFTYIHVESGTMVQKVNETLDGMGLALPTMAAFDRESIYGAIATSTHGTGLNVEGMPAMVQSLDLIAANGIHYRIEPTNGITDPVKFAAKYPNKEITLVQNDDRFYSCVVGFGLMGLVYSVVLKPVPAFYLKQTLWISNWKTVKPKLADRSFFGAINDKWDPIAKNPAGTDFLPTRAQVFVNPYITNNFITKVEDHTCVVQTQVEISREEYNDLKKNQQPQAGKLISLIEKLLEKKPADPYEAAQNPDKSNGIEELSTEALLSLLNDFPLLTPLFIDLSMILLMIGNGKFGKSFMVMNQGKLAIKNAGYSVEPGFAVNDTNDFIQGTEKIFDVTKLGESYASYLTAPICMRFVGKSKDHLSPEYDRNTCMTDVPMMLGTIGEEQVFDRMQKELMAIGARPHWGKVCNMVNGKTLVRSMYPKFDTFTETVRIFNPNGTFNSGFSYRTGLTELVYK